MSDEERYELEQELDDVEFSLDLLYDEDHALIPYVSDRVRSNIYDLRDRRDELKKLLAEHKG